MTSEKVKFQMRISPDTDRKIKTAMPLANVRSQNEFVANALRFYCSYLESQDSFSVLPPILRRSGPLCRTVKITSADCCSSWQWRWT